MNVTIMLDTNNTHDLFLDKCHASHYNNLGAPSPADPLPPTHSQMRTATTHGKSHHHQHRARRRNGYQASILQPRHFMTGLNLYITVVILISCCWFSPTAAQDTELPPKITDPTTDGSEELRSALAHLAMSGTIVADPRPPPPIPPVGNNHWQYIEGVEREGLIKRNTNSSVAAVTATTKATTTVASSSSSASAAATSLVASASVLPSPFDTSLGNNFTTVNCPAFITGFLNNATFKSCLPFSLLLESSTSFFDVEKSIVRVTQTLDYTCAANVTSCDQLMSQLAQNLTSPNNCGADFAAQNPTVVQAHMGLIAYRPLYTASCLRNPATSAYCFASAVTNASSPTDSYVYYIALDQNLPGGSRPTCNACLQNTMAVFNAAAANRSQPVASAYVAAAQQINVNCGPNFVNASLPASISSRGTLAAPAPLAMMTMTTALLVCLLALML